MPTPKKGETQQDFVSRAIPILLEEGTAKDNKQASAIAFSMYSEYKKKHKELKRRLCLRGLKKKEGEDYTYTALVATTHPDRVGDILSLNAINQITDYINTDNTVGGLDGAYRSVSLYHDWITQGDPTLDEAAFIKNGSAKTVELDDGHYGTEVEFILNKFYKGDMSIDEIEFRIEQGGIGGLSIEYDTTDNNCKNVNYENQDYRFIETLTEFGGVGLARSRMIANPHAVIYKEIENNAKKLKEEINMSEEKQPQEDVQVEETQEEEQSKPEQEPEKQPEQSSNEQDMENKEKPMSIKEFMKSDDYKNMVSDVINKVQVKSKIVKTIDNKEEIKMNGIKLHIKEMQDALKSNNGKMDIFAFKEAARKIYSTKEYNDSLVEDYKGYGIKLKSSEYPVMTYKETGNHSCKDIVSHRLRLPSISVKEIQTKDTLDTGSNTTSYTQSPVEFADLYVPGLLDTFNNMTDLFDALPKENHILGTPDYGWRIRTTQKSSLFVDRDDPAVTKSYAGKKKLQTPIKVYRNGISVTDFMIYHTRASMGDLFGIEAEIAMKDLRKDMNLDLYQENADGDSDALLGLEAVADSAGNTTLYGETRSTANRLSPDAAGNTYNNVSGALTTANIRAGISHVEVDGARRGDLLIVTSPYVRDALFELLDGQQQLFVNPDFGFTGAIRFDGIPVLVDSDCPSTATERQLYIIDLDSDVIVMSKMPQLTGLAKISAATEAYVEVYLAHVYKRPRRIHMLDNLT